MNTLFVTLLACMVPAQVSAEEISFLIQTTYASSEVPSDSSNPLPTGRAGRRYIENLNAENDDDSDDDLFEETVTSDAAPVAPIAPEQSSSSAASSQSFVSSTPVIEDVPEQPKAVAPTPQPTYTVKEQEELDELTLEQIEEYANEAEANLEEQLAQLEEGFSITGTSPMGSPLSPTQRSAILRRSIRTVGQLKIFSKALAESDGNLRQVTLDDERIEISYRQRAKLFGMIPITYLLKTTVEDGTVNVKQPWWHFLARDGVKDYKEELEKQLEEIGELNEDDPDLEEKLQQQQQTLQTISNVSKTLHDTGMAIIRKIGG